MPVREFTDSTGVEWRVWDVTAEQLHPVTRMEDLLELASGWLAFESATEKRRLPSPYPREWATLPLPELEVLCRRAPPVVRRAVRTSSEARVVEATALVDAERRTSEERRFSSPNGREWTVRKHECLTAGGSPRQVLRCTAEDIVMDLNTWPPDWKECSRTEYALMLLDANLPRLLGKDGPQRRRSDRPED
ncbi:MAG: hypothetical protein H0X64_04595 [Gemmatimonadaceae bacterium]|nr:hypothetical protein [Gemmatimonadaceae bacterium]